VFDVLKSSAADCFAEQRDFFSGLCGGDFLYTRGRETVCGRSLTFHEHRAHQERGYAPASGRAAKEEEESFPVRQSLTAHQAAEPRRAKCTELFTVYLVHRNSFAVCLAWFAVL
jgi:hypothetical protein